MDELLTRQLVRQLKIINTFLIIFAVTFLAFMIVTGIVVYKAVHEIHQAKASLDNLQSKVQSSLDLKSEVCGSDSSIGNLVKDKSKFCE